MATKENEQSAKVLLIGDTAVGKSSLLSRFVDDKFDENFHPTVGVEFASKCITIDETKLKLLIWDLGGQQQYRSITDSYYSGTHGVIAVFDLTREDSFEKLKRRLQELNEHWDGNVKKILVGNKYDLTYERVVGRETAKSLADSLNMQYAETSAKRPIYVEEMFKMLCNEIISIPKPELSIEECVPRDESVQDEMTTTSVYDYSFKIIILGDHGVGKTSLFLRFVEDSFDERPRKSLGADIKCRTFDINGKKVMLQLWDRGDAESSVELESQQMLKHVQGVVIVIDVTSEKPFENVLKWGEEFDRYGINVSSVVLVGNKCDLTNDRIVACETMVEFAESLGVPYVEASAKDSINVDRVFETIASELMSTIVTEEPPQAEDKSVENVVPIKRDYDHLCKIIVVGDAGVGKSSILSRFANNAFDENYIWTIGVDFKIRIIEVSDKKVKLQMWDMAGHERFRSITSSYYRGANGFIIVYDVTNAQSFENIKVWLDLIDRNADKTVKKVLVGNKCDLTSSRAIDQTAAQKFADSLHISYVEISAKSSQNIEQPFEIMGNQFISTISLNDNQRLETKSVEMTTPATNEYSHLIKLVIVGDSGVGKSSLLSRYVNNTFHEDVMPTIGAIRTLQVDGKTVKVSFWDTAGQERFRTITHSYYRGANGVIVVFDLTDQASFDNIEMWLQNIKQHGSSDVKILIVGNKCDLESKRVVAYEKAKELADLLNVFYMETSVKDSINTDGLLTNMLHELLSSK